MKTVAEFCPTVVIYHNRCSDGFGAAYCAWKFDPSIRLIPYNHKDATATGLEGQRVLMVDCCYPRNQLLAAKEIAEDFFVLDHHATMVDDCGDLDFCHFDLTQSGAGLAWKFFFPGKPLPALLLHVQDRDLGLNRLPSTRTFCAALDDSPRTFESWDVIAGMSPNEVKEFAVKGEVLLEQFHRLCLQLVEVKFTIDLVGFKVCCANAPFPFSSHAGNYLANNTDADCAMTFFVEGPNQAYLSFRSKKDGMDVEKLAAFFVGGGHKHASGARIRLTKLMEILNSQISGPVWEQAFADFLIAQEQKASHHD